MCGYFLCIGSWGPQPGAPVSVASVWDIEPPKSQAQSIEEIQMMEIERQRREADEREREREREIQVSDQRVNTFTKNLLLKIVNQV